VADQENVSVEHLVQDGLSTDGTAEYLLSEPRVQAVSQKDQGMYDAINQAWSKTTGDYVLHLNADEELLPGSLSAVGEYFREHPEVDIVLGGVLVCESDGKLHCYRKPIRPTLDILVTSHLPNYTCGIFLRKSSFLDRPWLYDPAFRLVSDVLLMIDIVRAGKNIGVLDLYTSVFFVTGANMGLVESPTSAREYAHQLSLATHWQRKLKWPIKAKFLLSKLFAGHYRQGPVSYDLYLPGQEEARQHFTDDKPSGIFRPSRTSETT
jgi:glycosyltransferase involved in cell wall biosynthesis